MKRVFKFLLRRFQFDRRPTRIATGGMFVTLAFLLLVSLPAMAVSAHPTFADTKFNPSSQTTAVGTPTSVDLVFVVPGGGAYGIDTWVSFDPSVLQVTSLTGSGVWTTDSAVTGYDNTAGTIRYKATGSNLYNQTITIATIVFNPVAAGTSPLNFQNVNQYIPGYGPYGVNGLAVSGAIEVTGTVQTVTFLGGVTDNLYPVGSIDPTTEWYDTQSGTWKPAYLVGPHPWGQADGTNSWLNIGPSFYYGLNTTVDYRVRFALPEDFTDASGELNIMADNIGTFILNGTALGTYENTRGIFPLDASVLVPGINELTIRVVDYGGLAGFNYRADFSVVSDSPIIVIPPDATPPVITHVVSGTMGDNGWYTSNVDITFSATDAESEITETSPAGNPYTYNLTSDTASTTVTYAATSAGGTADDAVTVKIDQTPPVLTPPADVTAEATGTLTMVSIGAATAVDAIDPVPSISNDAPAEFPLGTTTVTWTATDAAGNSSAATQTVTVVDTTAPEIEYAAITTSIWSPNHKLAKVASVAGASDAVDTNPNVAITITSNQVANGIGDGNTASDWQVDSNGDIYVRAERDGGGADRVYYVTITATDASGNEAQVTLTVTVPHDQGEKETNAKKGKK